MEVFSRIISWQGKLRSLSQNEKYCEKYVIRKYEELTVITTSFFGPGLDRHKTDYNFLAFSGALYMLGIMHRHKYIHGDVSVQKILLYLGTPAT